MASPEDPRCHAHLSLRRGALAIGSRISDAVEASSKKQSLARDGKKISGEGNGEREAEETRSVGLAEAPPQRSPRPHRRARVSPRRRACEGLRARD